MPKPMDSEFLEIEAYGCVVKAETMGLDRFTLEATCEENESLSDKSKVTDNVKQNPSLPILSPGA